MTWVHGCICGLRMRCINPFAQLPTYGLQGLCARHLQGLPGAVHLAVCKPVLAGLCWAFPAGAPTSQPIPSFCSWGEHWAGRTGHAARRSSITGGYWPWRLCRQQHSQQLGTRCRSSWPRGSGLDGRHGLGLASCQRGSNWGAYRRSWGCRAGGVHRLHRLHPLAAQLPWLTAHQPCGCTWDHILGPCPCPCSVVSCACCSDPSNAVSGPPTACPYLKQYMRLAHPWPAPSIPPGPPGVCAHP